MVSERYKKILWTLPTAKVVDSDANMAESEMLKSKLDAKMSIGGVKLSKITVKTRSNSSQRRCSYTLSQHLDREVFIRFNTSWSNC